MEKFIYIKDDTIINISNILRIDRFYTKNPDYIQWQDEYEKTMNDVIKKYIENHPDVLMTTKTDEEIIGELRNKFDKHIKKQLGEVEPGFMSYLIYTKNEQVTHISEKVYNDICKMFNVDMTGHFDDFYNFSDTIYGELKYAWG